LSRHDSAPAKPSGAPAGAAPPTICLGWRTMTSSYWIHDLSPFLFRFSDTFGIRYYGLAYVIGFVGAW
jgi:hypothetical protein